jgi:prepilin signal peptidase PulO-like enzyme (type II secretory pathway)
VVGTVIGIPLRLLRSQREIPFGPSLAIGALLAAWLGPDVQRLILHR